MKIRKRKQDFLEEYLQKYSDDRRRFSNSLKLFVEKAKTG